MPLEPGTTLGSYQVTAKIGEGGMGEVYQARDTRLDRNVALKVLPEAFTADPDRLARFEREAKVLASLNHPNIGTIHGLEESDGVKALVLELVEGPTLADRIAHGPIPLDEALPIARQIADALEAAHEQGVIHRDLKPANVKVKHDGTVKVLDFGLAKAFQPDSSDPNMSMSPTISLTAAATQMGMVIGTAAYMAPEQAKGKIVDKRADVWAFGAVLYEMLTGQKPFSGEDVSETLATVIKTDPEWDALPADTPARLRQLVRACLAKNPKQRVHDVADVRLAMEGAFETTVSAPADPATSPQLRLWQRPVPALLVVLLVAVIAGLAAVWSMPRPPAGSLARFVVVTPPDGPVNPTNPNSDVAISPDGARIVYVSGSGPGDRHLYVRSLDQLDATLLRGTQDGYAPFFSPDGESVGFRGDGTTLKRVSVLGGPAQSIADTDSPVRGASWGPDDRIVFATLASKGLLRIRSVGGEPEVLTTVDPEQGETDHFWPEVLPNGKGVLFTAWSGTDEGSRIAVVSTETGQITYLLPGGSHPRYSPTGHLVYGVGGTLRAVGFDAERLALTSDNPVPVVENATTKGSGAASFGVADNGSLVYVSDGGAGAGAQLSLVWVDREGDETLLDSPPLDYTRPRVSPDGTRVAVDVGGAGASDIWIHDLGRGTEAILTTDATIDRAPLWTPDGERVVFYSDRDGSAALFSKLVDTPGEAELVMAGSEGTTFIEPSAWSDDGRTLVFWQAGAEAPDIGLLSMGGDGASELLLATESVESGPSISSDGNWIAYSSTETGQPEVYVQRFPGLGDKLPISTDGGQQPLWSPDGSELFYRGPRGMMAVPVETEPMFSAGAPEVLFEQRYYYFRSDRTYDVAPDGRFLMIKAGAPTDDAAASTAQIVLVEHWFEELKRLVPVVP